MTNIATVTANVGDSSDTVSDTASATVTVDALGAVSGETNVPLVTAPPTDSVTPTRSDPSSTLPLLLIVLGVIGLGAVVLTPRRAKKH